MIVQFRQFVVFFFAFNIVTTVVVIPSKAKGADAKAATRIAAQTVYLHEGIEGFHRIAIFGQLGGKGTAIFTW